MDGTASVRGETFVVPRISDYGDLLAITADAAVMGHLGFTTFAQASAPLGPSGGVLPDDPASPADPEGGESIPSGEAPGDGGDTAGTGGEGSGAGGGGGGGGGDDSLPFTGFSAGVLGGLGAALSATGVVLRKHFARRG